VSEKGDSVGKTANSKPVPNSLHWFNSIESAVKAKLSLNYGFLLWLYSRIVRKHKVPKKIRIDSDEIEFLVNGGEVYGIWAEVSLAPHVLVRLGRQEAYRPGPQDPLNVTYWKFAGCTVFFAASFEDLEQNKGKSLGVLETVIFYN